MLLHQRFVHEGDRVAQRAADRDDGFDGRGIALVRHGGGADLALVERLGELVDLGMRQVHDFVRHLGEAAADQPEHADIFDQAVARRLPGDVGDAETEARHDPLVELEGTLAERRLAADRADQAADEGAVLQLREALMIAPGFGEPDRAFVAERDRQRLHGVGAAGHRRGLVALGEPEQLAPDGLQIALEHRMRVLDLQHDAGIEHILGGRAEVEILAVVAVADRLQRAQRRHQRVLDAADLGGDRLEVDIADLGLAGDLGCGDLRNDAELGLRQRQRRLVVVPFLHAVRVVEDRAQLLGAPQVLEQGRSKTPDGMAGPQRLMVCTVSPAPRLRRGYDRGCMKLVEPSRSMRASRSTSHVR